MGKSKWWFAASMYDLFNYFKGKNLQSIPEGFDVERFGGDFVKAERLSFNPSIIAGGLKNLD